MTKVLLDGIEYELVDELEKGEEELDLLSTFSSNDDDKLDDTLELHFTDLEDTIEMDKIGDIDEWCFF